MVYKFNDKTGRETGLRVWIAFIIGFWLAGFRAELCILLGAIGGGAAYFLTGRWQSEKDYLPTEPTAKPKLPAPALPLGDVFRKPAEGIRKIGVVQKLPRIPEMPKLPRIREKKPRRRL
jgi:hypothetical protein